MTYTYISCTNTCANQNWPDDDLMTGRDMSRSAPQWNIFIYFVVFDGTLFTHSLSGWCQNCYAVRTFPNLFCLDISLSPTNVLIVYLTLQFIFSFCAKAHLSPTSFLLYLVVNEVEQTEVSRWFYRFYQVRVHCVSSLASRQVGLYGMNSEQIVVIRMVNKRPVIKSEFLMRAVTDLVQ
jgi:hypothetical protein